jgi:hypothetical protein
VYGVGALLAAAVGVLLVGRRLGVPILGAALLLSGVLAALAADLGLVGALALLTIAGASRALLDVASRSLLQRSVPAQSLGQVFGLLEGLTMAGLAIGAVLVPALVQAGHRRHAGRRQRGSGHRGRPGLRPGSAQEVTHRVPPRSGAGAPGDAQTAYSHGREPGHAMPGLALVRLAALAGGAGQFVMLSLAVQVGDPVLGHLVGKGGVHRGLPVTWLSFPCQLRPAAGQPSVTGTTALLSACRQWQCQRGD